ncbi:MULTISPECIES: hypothetical protein [unclassified Nostoc]|uniref:hypothetical protein n=1 Tax=unclassified Nostoc TaxID=2593658 RepID=UPI002AD22FCC|nr:hypothetical protein [Nostoc sp. DedQUE03]MDZ7977273.1 hypothetical protein [Nostoc sp. DedQUE03]MDZ8047606.1 hypothetical protein [Nostoc sp. DedQUE02]
MAKVIRGGKIHTWNTNKHPRGNKGRFAETPDAPKAATGRRSSATRGKSVTREKGLSFERSPKASKLTRTEILRQSGVIKSAKHNADVYQARLELYQGLNHEQRQRLLLVQRLNPGQRRRLLEVLKTKDEAKEVEKPLNERSQSTPATGKYLAANPDHLGIKGNKLTIWDGKPELAKAQGGFKTRKVKDFEYSVEVDGKQVVLNRNTNMHEYMGDRIYGMPSLTPRLASMTPVQLADGLAKYMTKVETKDSTVPDWLPTYHGKVDKTLTPKGYGKMQQHHVHQWAKVPLDTVVKDYESGKITLDEAKAQTQAILSRETKKTKSGRTVEDWVLNPADKNQRSFVVLPGGLHDISNRKMYLANHPMGIDVDASEFKLRSYRLPEFGDSGRRWHSDTFRPGSWTEIYRRESYILLGELNRRVAKGEVTHQEAQKLFREGLDKVDKANQYRLQYSKSQGS